MTAAAGSPVALDLEYGPLGRDSWWLRAPDGAFLQVDGGTLAVLRAVDGRLPPEDAARELDLDRDDLAALLAALAAHGALRPGARPSLRPAQQPRDGARVWLAALALAAALGALAQACFFLLGRPSLTVTGPAALAALLLVLATVPLHEGAHRLAARGCGTVRLGLTWAAVFPTLYVEAQGAWALSRSRRCAIDAAGVAADTAAGGAAALAALLAPAAAPAVTAFLLTQFARTALALNPLLLSDGYWLLSDLTGVPNLSRRARESLRALRLHWLTAYAALSYACAGLAAGLLALFLISVVAALARAL
ncbi:MAG TPA: hypothetical protein VIO14_12080 [Dehalococcoidia bacterium]